MKAISMYQPWAFWASFGIKGIETRLHKRFQSFLGKTIAIHAGLKYDRKAFSIAKKFVNYNHLEHQKDKLIYGAVICTAFVYRVGWLNSSHSKRACIDCGEINRFGLFLKDVKPLTKPIYIKGRQGPFNIDIEDVSDFKNLQIHSGIKIEQLSLNLHQKELV